jgi:hypothetical protein
MVWRGIAQSDPDNLLHLYSRARAAAQHYNTLIDWVRVTVIAQRLFILRVILGFTRRISQLMMLYVESMGGGSNQVNPVNYLEVQKS